MGGVNINTWDFATQNVDASIQPDQFASSAECLIYTAPIGYDSSGAEVPSDFSAIGTVQQFADSEQKQIEVVYEIGSDVPYLIPGHTQPGGLTLIRTLISGMDLLNALYQMGTSGVANPAPGGTLGSGLPVLKSLRDIKAPLTIAFAAFGSNPDGSFSVKASRVYDGVHLTARGSQFNAASVLISEQVQMMFKMISDAQFVPPSVNTTV